MTLIDKASVLMGVFALMCMGMHVVHGIGRTPVPGAGLSPYGPSPQAVSSASPLPSLSRGEGR